MAAPSLRFLVASVCLFAVAIARGQDRSQYAPVTPTFTERLGQFRDNLFGGGEPEMRSRSHGRLQNAPQQRASSPGLDRKSTPQRPSQSAAASATYGTTGRGYVAPSANNRPQASGERSQADVRNLSPNQIEHNDVPTLSRRPSFGAAFNAESQFGPGASNSDPTSSRSLQDRLSAARQGNAGLGEPASQGNGETNAASGSAASSRRASPFSGANLTSNKVQEMINPMVPSAKGAATKDLSAVSRAQPAVSGPAAAPGAEPAATNLTSSRRGIAASAPGERVASLVRDRAPGVEAMDADVLFKRQSPLISVATNGPRTIVIAKEATYTVVVQNAGEVAAQEVIVTIRVPEWADVVATKESAGIVQLPQGSAGAADSLPSSGRHAVQWSLPRFDAHGKEQLSLQIVPRESRPFDLAVQTAFTPIASSAQVEVQEPKLLMNLTGPSEVLYGDTKIYKMTLSNPGSGDAENVAIHLSPLASESGAPTKHQIGTIKAGDTKVIEVELTARQTGKVTIHAAATADGGLQAEVAEEVTVRRAELETKIVGSKAKYAGTVGSYQIEVNNPGNAPAENVQVVATLPAGAKFIAANNGGQASADGAKVQWTIPTIRAGGDAVLELKCQVNNPGANRLAVQSTATGDLSAAAEEFTQVEALADLTLDVIEPKGPIAVGADVMYEIRVQNRGTKNANDVKLVGYFSGKIDPVAATGGEHRLVPGIVIFKPIASIAAGGEAVFKITARANSPGNHMFKAEVICESAGAKLGSEHTTLFYGDEVIPNGDERHASEEPARPLAPKSVFQAETNQPAELAPALQKTPFPQPGSAYAPAIQPQSGHLPSLPAASAQTAPEQSGAPVLPISPFSLRPNAKKK